MTKGAAQFSPNDLIRAAEQLDAPELERVIADLLALLAHRKAPALDQTEAELFQRINRGIPADVQQRYDVLIVRRRAEQLTPDEYSDLLQLTERIARIEAERTADLAMLARLRNIPMVRLKADLGISVPAQHG